MCPIAEAAIDSRIMRKAAFIMLVLVVYVWADFCDKTVRVNEIGVKELFVVQVINDWSYESLMTGSHDNRRHKYWLGNYDVMAFWHNSMVICLPSVM
jgi:hypothetical protein